MSKQMRTVLNIYRWARDNDAPDWIALPALALTLSALWVLLDAIEVTMK